MSHSMSRGVAGIPWKGLKNLETCCEPTQHEKSRPSLAAISFSFGGLQPVEIPQNRQSFLWKSLQKTSGDLEKLGERFGGAPLFRRLCSSRDAAAAISRPGGAPRQGGKIFLSAKS
jgi:hypothetical protein